MKEKEEAGSFPILNSVSTALFRRVFLYYLLLAILVTLFHMLFEFDSAKEHVQAELRSIGESVEPGLATALWNIHHEQVISIINGTQGLPIVTGMQVRNEKGQVVGETGDTTYADESSQDEAENTLNPLADTYAYRETLYFKHGSMHGSERTKVGELLIFSSAEVAFERVKLGFWLILLSSLVKSLALWALFICFSRSILSKPLLELTNLVRNTSSESLEVVNAGRGEVNGNNELSLLKRAFHSMIEELADSHDKLQAYAMELESKVQERTRNLAESQGQLQVAYRDLEVVRQNELAVHEEKKQFMADISHELRTPLATIKLQLEALEQGISPAQQGYGVLRRKLEQIERVVSDLSILAKTDINALELRYEEIEVVSFLLPFIEMYTRQAVQNGLSLSFDLSNLGAVTVNADRERLSQVFSNLLNNSLKYTDHGGKVLIQAKRDERHVVFTITDSSPGVNDEELKHLFDRLYRPESSRSRDTGGSGLGLSICKSIVEAHNGSIELGHSQLGGLLVSIELPVYTPLDAEGKGGAEELP